MAKRVSCQACTRILVLFSTMLAIMTFTHVVLPAPVIGPDASLAPDIALWSKPQGAYLVRLLKKVADQALLLQPEQMAKVLDIPMTFETNARDVGKSCDAGGYDKSVSVTKAKVGASWYKATSEGVANMEIPPAFINPGTIAGAPAVSYALYRSVRCKSPSFTHVESTLDFANLSGFSCLTPDVLQKLIGAKYRLYTDGVSGSAYSPRPTDDYGITLDFTFRMGAPCAVGASIRLDSHSSLRERRAFLKWRACYDEAVKELCRSRGGRVSISDGHQRGNEACEDRETYIEREPSNVGSAPPLPDFPGMTDNACDEYFPPAK